MRNLNAASILFTIVLAAFPASAEQSPSTSASPAPNQSSMSGMKGMGKGSGMSGMSMEQQMARCTEIREQMKQGKPMSADMQKAMKECDDMDRQMQMPSGTKNR